MMFSIAIMSTLKAIKSHFKQSYDKQNLILVAISYEIYETRQGLVSYISYEMTTRVRASKYTMYLPVGYSLSDVAWSLHPIQ